ncbi:hypothetical protein TNCT_654541 [Trichonephila clavata]|uniref:Uncharacterized protein n=1 Tax=Trichonephila clavata TaxID=2740835 RepID=A0A8X6LZQ0_TRICU|nr:hypothetical protein TNCT_654541 [Trichonephila clavata]
MALEVLNNIPPDSLTINTDGSKFEDGRAESSVFIDNYEMDDRFSGHKTLTFDRFFNLKPFESLYLHKSKLLSLWRQTPDHNWYAASNSRLPLSCSGPRTLQSSLVRFRNGHLRPMKFQFSPCSLPVSPSYLTCLGVSCRHLVAEQRGTLNYLCDEVFWT